MSLKFTCPNCNKAIPTDPTDAGGSTNCPECDWIVRIPKIDTLVGSRERIKFLCPSCGRKLSATTAQYGTEMPCPYTDCEKPILIPRPEWSPAPIGGSPGDDVRPSKLVSNAEQLTRGTTLGKEGKD